MIIRAKDDERHEYAVLMRVEFPRQLHRITRVPHPLEATIGGSIRAPAGHAGDVELSIAGMEASPVHA